MTKKELIDSISSKTGLGVAETSKTIETFIQEVKDNVMKGRPIFIRGFGTFELKVRAARKARDLKENKEIDLPERKVPVFKVSRNFEN